MKKYLPMLLSATIILSTASSGHSQQGSNSDFAFTTSSGQAMATFKTGLRFYDQGDSKKARESFRKALDADPNFVLAGVYLAHLALSPKELATHLARAKENLAGANEWEKLMYSYVETRLKSDLDNRLAIAEKMVAQFPNNARAYVHLGETHEIRGNIAKARESYQRAIAIDPAWPGSYYALTNSFLLREPKDARQAEATATQLVNIAPSGSTYTLLGATYRSQNNLRKAEETLTKAIQLDGSLPGSFLDRGNIRTFLGEYDKAKKDFEQATVLSEVPTAARQCMAFLHLHQDKPAKAIESLLNDAEKFSAKMEASTAATFKTNLLGVASTIAAHTNDAQKLKQIMERRKPLLEDFFNQFGTEEAGINHKAELLYGEAMLKLLNNDLAGATKTAEEMKTVLEPIKNPNKLNGYEFLLGRISMKLMNYQKAIIHFEKTNPSLLYNRYHLAKAYEAAGDKEKANAIFKEIADYNYNFVGYALIRNELKKKGF